MRKILLGICLMISSLFYSASADAASTTFKDVGSTHWAKEEISYLSGKGIINGYGYGVFAPNDTIKGEHGMLMVERVTKSPAAFPITDPKKPLTRGEVALLITSNFNLSEKGTYSFTDVDKNHPYYQAIQILASNQIVIGYEDGTFRPDKTVTRAEFSVFLSRVLDTKFRKVVTLEQQAKQRIVVTSTSKTTANVQLQEHNGTSWKNVKGPYKAVIGKNGIGKTKEGDGKTPTGTYALGTAFGWGAPLKNLNYSYRPTNAYDYWVDDVNSKEYNKWISFSGDPNQRWKSYERMNHPLYKYGVVIRYNEDPIVVGKGSAIFLHMKNSTTKYTQGCIALNEADLKTVIQWLNKSKNPIVIIK